jgi:hypothetical protein
LFWIIGLLMLWKEVYAYFVAENGGGLSAAVELRLDDKTLEDCNLDLAHVHMHMDLLPLASTTGPTPSQQVEIRRMKQMRDIREGKLYPEDIDDEYTRSELGSVSSKSSKDAMLTPLRTVDVHGSRSFHRWTDIPTHLNSTIQSLDGCGLYICNTMKYTCMSSDHRSFRVCIQ